MPETLSLELLQIAQNNFINERTNEINQLKLDTGVALQNLNELSHRVYGYNHDTIIYKNLEAAYSDIIEENSDLAELSAVGITVLLHSGDTIAIQGNRMFINGTEEQTDYAFSGENASDGIEFVNVWFFENNNSLVLSDEIDFYISEIKIFEKSAHIVLNNRYTYFVNTVETLHFSPAKSIYCIELTENGVAERLSANAANTVVAYRSDMTSMHRNFLGLAKNTNLKMVDLPELLTIGNTTDKNDMLATFSGCTNPNLTFNFPKLKTISGGNPTNAIFRSVRKVELPESVKSIYYSICDSNEIIVLNCKDATSISDTWCTKAPTSALVMCADWGASINIATSAANWSKADFIDLFANKLRDMGENTKDLKIPVAIYNSLTDEEFALAENKGWTIGH